MRKKYIGISPLVASGISTNLRKYVILMACASTVGRKLPTPSISFGIAPPSIHADCTKTLREVQHKLLPKAIKNCITVKLDKTINGIFWGNKYDININDVQNDQNTQKLTGVSDNQYDNVVNEICHKHKPNLDQTPDKPSKTWRKLQM